MAWVSSRTSGHSPRPSCRRPRSCPCLHLYLPYRADVPSRDSYLSVQKACQVWGKQILPDQSLHHRVHGGDVPKIMGLNADYDFTGVSDTPSHRCFTFLLSTEKEVKDDKEQVACVHVHLPKGEGELKKPLVRLSICTDFSSATSSDVCLSSIILSSHYLPMCSCEGSISFSAVSSCCVFSLSAPTALLGL